MLLLLILVIIIGKFYILSTIPAQHLRAPLPLSPWTASHFLPAHFPALFFSPFHTAVQLIYFQKTKSTGRSFCFGRLAPCSLTTTPSSSSKRKSLGGRQRSPCSLVASAPVVCWCCRAIRSRGGLGRESGGREQRP